MTDLATITREAHVNHPHGLHARPSHAVVALSQRMGIMIELESQGRIADTSSIMSVMALGVAPGEVVLVRASGLGAQEAVDAMVELLESDFGEST